MKMKNILYLLSCFLLVSCNQNNKPIPPVTVPSTDTIKIKQPVIDSSLIVIDTTTHLTWSKNDFSYINKRFLKEWKEVFDWQTEMNAKQYAGYNDWRIPSITEYRTINGSTPDRKRYRKVFNELDTTCVWGKGAYCFWSSTTPNKNTASYIDFNDGFATSGDRGKQWASGSWKGIEFGMSVRLVRGNTDTTVAAKK